MPKRGDWGGDKVIIVLHPQDDRRHRKWCDNYRAEDGFCYKTFGKCGGSAHCKYYKATKKPCAIQSQPTQKPAEPLMNPNHNKQPFSGIQLIKMKDILMPRHAVHPPAPKKVAELKEYYAEHGTLDKPIIVSCAGTKYRLEDKYLRYYVAKQLGLQEIPAKIGTKDKIKPEDALRKKGSRILHTKYGVVTVIESDLKHVTVKTDNDEIIALDIETCLRNNLVKVID